MKKCKTNVKSVDGLSETLQEPLKKNPVAKFAGKFNKAKVEDDKTSYKRKAKYVRQEE